MLSQDVKKRLNSVGVITDDNVDILHRYIDENKDLKIKLNKISKSEKSLKIELDEITALLSAERIVNKGVMRDIAGVAGSRHGMDNDLVKILAFLFILWDRHFHWVTNLLVWIFFAFLVASGVISILKIIF